MAVERHRAQVEVAVLGAGLSGMSAAFHLRQAGVACRIFEREARAAKTGIWAAGEPERPSEFRAKVWEEAKRRATDGCPIKGRVAGGERVYVLPWAPDYERGRIQKAKGERWFCSEAEAVSAGWKPSARG